MAEVEPIDKQVAFVSLLPMFALGDSRASGEEKK